MLISLDRLLCRFAGTIGYLEMLETSTLFICYVAMLDITKTSLRDSMFTDYHSEGEVGFG
jgi:hypothetical protein